MNLRFAIILLLAIPFMVHAGESTPARSPLPKIRLTPNGTLFVTEKGEPFVAFGCTYYRPGTGWAPQVWKQFDAETTRQDFARMKELGVNCVRVFLTFGSFYMQPGVLSEDGLKKFDQFLAIAEEAGIYVHPTGPDHWEGVPEWGHGDRYADEKVLSALETYWKLFATRYRARNVIFAYDLLNEPAIRWESATMRVKWNEWVQKKYDSVDKLSKAWSKPADSLQFGQIPVPPSKDAPGDRALLDYQLFRESLADAWTQRQVAAIKSVDPSALVTVGFIQWSVPALLPGLQHYAGFRPERQAKFLDFLEVHFYPLEHGFYEYKGAEDEGRNLAYVESVVREVARPGKPVIVAEFGWYGGGQLTIDGGKHPPATEEQQARWCRRLVETTQGLAMGWLNWGFYDHPQARDVSQLTGLLTVEGKSKVWGVEFKKLAAQPQDKGYKKVINRLNLDWDACLTSTKAANTFRENYYQQFKASP